MYQVIEGRNHLDKLSCTISFIKYSKSVFHRAGYHKPRLVNPLSIFINLLVVQALSVGSVFAQDQDLGFNRGASNSDYVRGVVAARDTAVISSSINGSMIKAIPFSDGEAFKKGDILVRFDCTRSEAEAKAAWAAAHALETTLNSNLELDQYGAIGKNDVLISEANLNRAQSEAAALDAAIKDCIIKAPYSGKVVERFSSLAESPTTGTPLIKIHRESNLELKLIVPSNWLSWLTPGTPFSIKIDENGKTHKAKVLRIGATVDPVSKTIRVIGRFDGIPKNTLPGMSGYASFTPVEQN